MYTLLLVIIVITIITIIIVKERYYTQASLSATDRTPFVKKKKHHVPKIQLYNLSNCILSNVKDHVFLSNTTYTTYLTQTLFEGGECVGNLWRSLTMCIYIYIYTHIHYY